MTDELWPIGSIISIIGQVRQDGKIEYSACLVLGWPDKRTFVNKDFPEHNMVKAVRECYDQWKEEECQNQAGIE